MVLKRCRVSGLDQSVGGGSSHSWKGAGGASKWNGPQPTTSRVWVAVAVSCWPFAQWPATSTLPLTSINPQPAFQGGDARVGADVRDPALQDGPGTARGAQGRRITCRVSGLGFNMSQLRPKCQKISFSGRTWMELGTHKDTPICKQKKNTLEKPLELSMCNHN